ncbi:2OG-Fe(II) oxygenase [Pycnococcus provasolii]
MSPQRKNMAVARIQLLAVISMGWLVYTPCTLAGRATSMVPDTGTPLADALLDSYKPGDDRFSLLGNATKDDVFAEPYPHIFKTNALPQELYDALAEAFPPMSKAFKRGYPKNNVRVDMPAFKTLKNYDPNTVSHFPVHALWQRFVDYHISSAFYQKLSELAGEHIRKSYGNAVVYGNERFKGVSSRTLKRGDRKSSVDLDCQISYNTPTLTKSSVRGPHIDDSAKIYGSLFYMRHPNDTSKGGDFQVYNCNGACKPLPPSKIKSSAGHKVHTQFGSGTVSVAKTVPYQANTLVLFINSKRAVHGVTPRTPSRLPRIFVNLIGNRL